MNYLSLFSGIEAATQAFHPLGWSPFGFAEVDPFASAVLKHHYPNVRNLGDVTKFKEWPDGHVDLVCGGSPCQSFSVAGLRKGMDDPRGNLALVYLAIVDRYRPRWIVYENVPGLLSSNGGRDFGAFLGALAKLGYGWSFRILDAQFCRTKRFPRAVPQRRRRIVLVGHSGGDWQRANAVLFDSQSLQRNPPPRRETGKGIAHDVAPCLGASGRGFERTGDTRGQDAVIATATTDISHPLLAKGNDSFDDTLQSYVAHSLRGEGFDASGDGTGRGTPLVPVAFGGNNCGGHIDGATACNAHGGTGRMDFESETFVAHSLRAEGFDASEAGMGRGTPIVPINFQTRGSNIHVEQGLAATVEARSVPQAVQHGWAVRRLTPTECERLMGFPDGFTDIPWRGKPHSPDGLRYKALGNSWAVNVFDWVGQRIAAVEAMS